MENVITSENIFILCSVLWEIPKHVILFVYKCSPKKYPFCISTSITLICSASMSPTSSPAQVQLQLVQMRIFMPQWAPAPSPAAHKFASRPPPEPTLSCTAYSAQRSGPRSHLVTSCAASGVIKLNEMDFGLLLFFTRWHGLGSASYWLFAFRRDMLISFAP